VKTAETIPLWLRGDGVSKGNTFFLKHKTINLSHKNECGFIGSALISGSGNADIK
jgi:hypothetical protein